MDELTKVSHKLAEEIYKQASQKQQQGQDPGARSKGGAQEPGEEKSGAGGPTPGGDDVIDAEFKEEDDKDK